MLAEIAAGDARRRRRRAGLRVARGSRDPAGRPASCADAGDRTELIGDVPLFRHAHRFDPEPGRLEVDGRGEEGAAHDAPTSTLPLEDFIQAVQSQLDNAQTAMAVKARNLEPAAHLRDQGHHPRPARACRVRRQRDPHPAGRRRRQGGERLPPRLHRDHPPDDRGERDRLLRGPRRPVARRARRRLTTTNAGGSNGPACAPCQAAREARSRAGRARSGGSPTSGRPAAQGAGACLGAAGRACLPVERPADDPRRCRRCSASAAATWSATDCLASRSAASRSASSRADERRAAARARRRPVGGRARRSSRAPRPRELDHGLRPARRTGARPSNGAR